MRSFQFSDLSTSHIEYMKKVPLADDESSEERATRPSHAQLQDSRDGHKEFFIFWPKRTAVAAVALWIMLLRPEKFNYEATVLIYYFTFFVVVGKKTLVRLRSLHCRVFTYGRTRIVRVINRIYSKTDSFALCGGVGNQLLVHRSFLPRAMATCLTRIDYAMQYEHMPARLHWLYRLTGISNGSRARFTCIPVDFDDHTDGTYCGSVVWARLLLPDEFCRSISLPIVVDRSGRMDSMDSI